MTCAEGRRVKCVRIGVKKAMQIWRFVPASNASTRLVSGIRPIVYPLLVFYYYKTFLSFVQGFLTKVVESKPAFFYNRTRKENRRNWYETF